MLCTLRDCLMVQEKKGVRPILCKRKDLAGAMSLFLVGFEKGVDDTEPIYATSCALKVSRDLTNGFLAADEEARRLASECSRDKTLWCRMRA